MRKAFYVIATLLVVALGAGIAVAVYHSGRPRQCSRILDG